jgi:hypothetical protein
MVKNRRAVIALALLAAVAVWLLFFRGDDPPVAGSAPATTSRSGPAAEDVPWINLDRLKADNPEVALGGRNIFSYGPVPPPPTPEPTEAPPDGGIPPSTMPDTPPPTPPPPAIPLKFMGVVKATNGPRIAVLMTEQKEILHGREGDVLAGRYKVVQIGLESIKVQEVVSGHEQTIRIGGH